MIIGLTGGIACGKSTVSSMLVRRGAILIDADRVAREVVLPGSPALDKVFARFGQAVRAEDGTLLRKKLGEIVFRDEAARRDLEAILHPAIREEIRRQRDEWERRCPDKLIVADIPLLFESGRTEYPEVMLVYVPESVQLTRLMERDGLTEERAMARIRAQMPIEEKKKLAHIVIDNSGTLEETDRQIDLFWKRKGLP